MDIAAARMENDLFADSLLVEGFLQIFAHQTVRDENDFVVRQVRNDFENVGAGDANVAFGLDVGGRIDVAYERVVRIFFAQVPNFVARNAVGEAAAGKRSRNENVLFRVQDFGRFAHEADRGEHNHVGVHLGGVLAELETVPVVIGDAQDDFGRDVAVGENHRVAFLFQLVYLVDERNQFFAVFERVAAKYGTRLDFFQSVEKFLRSHSGKNVEILERWPTRPGAG